MSGDTYQCDQCHGVFECDAEWGAAERAAEHVANFGFAPDDDAAVICEVCYERFMAWGRPRGLLTGGAS